MWKGSVCEHSVWKEDWNIALIWRSELQSWPSHRVADSTCCLTDLWATYQSHNGQTVVPMVTGQHLPASHSITADSARRSVDRGHVGGCSQVHDPSVPSGVWSARSKEVKGHKDNLNDWLHARWDSSVKITRWLCCCNDSKFFDGRLQLTMENPHVPTQVFMLM